MLRKIAIALVVFAIFYLGVGLAFHLKWESAATACREARVAQGGFVEPEVFGGALGLLFDVTNWPVYIWANLYNFGEVFPTPCSRSANTFRGKPVTSFLPQNFGG